MKKDHDLVEQVNLHLQNRYCVSAEQSKSILGTIALTLKKNLVDLRGTLESNDLPAMALHLHSIKGALLNLGQKELAETAELIETASRAGKKFDYLVSVEKIENMLEPLIDRPR